MYSQQLETLIQGIIADGEITERERRVLHKRAEAEGIDIDEIDVYVDGLIDKMASKEAVTHEDYNVAIFRRFQEADEIFDVYRKSFCFYPNKESKNWEDGNYQVLLFYYKGKKESKKQLCLAIKVHKDLDYFNIDDLVFTSKSDSVHFLKKYIYHSSVLGSPSIFIFDETDLKNLCMSSGISVRVQYSYKYERKDEEGKIIKDEKGWTIWEKSGGKFEQSLPTFHKFLQEFYHNAVDGTLFTNVKTEVKQIRENFIQAQKEKERKEKRASMIEDKISDIIFMPFASPRKFAAIGFAIFFTITFVKSCSLFYS